MCGIIGIVSRPPTRETPTADQILGGLDAALTHWQSQLRLVQ